MSSGVYFSIINLNQYTGSEETRIMALLTILATVSIIMWLIVLVSIVLRIGAKLLIRRSRHLPKTAKSKDESRIA